MKGGSTDPGKAGTENKISRCSTAQMRLNYEEAVLCFCSQVTTELLDMKGLWEEQMSAAAWTKAWDSV